ncbi:unnamed protein product [Mytilus edulis]|uniref:Uncharacterized protein n=1 Tax=Mytilus edulis TaxID=6550 RepID=A0A8S3PSX9_MYTED|nr:unnamed protein product [Mytilus edulis]
MVGHVYCPLSKWLDTSTFRCQHCLTHLLSVYNMVGHVYCPLSTWLDTSTVHSQHGWTHLLSVDNMVVHIYCPLTTWLYTPTVRCQNGWTHQLSFVVNMVGHIYCPLTTWLDTSTVRCQHGIPSCVYPCAWRGDAIPILIERDGIWINNRPNGGTFTNTSLPNGQQTAPSACIIRHGPFFLGKLLGGFACFKVMQISDTKWYYYVGEVIEDLKDFCTMCDGTKMMGPIYMTDIPSSSDRARPIGCTTPYQCPRTNKRQVRCSDDEPFGSGMNCKRQHHYRRYSRSVGSSVGI